MCQVVYIFKKKPFPLPRGCKAIVFVSLSPCSFPTDQARPDLYILVDYNDYFALSLEQRQQNKNSFHMKFYLNGLKKREREEKQKKKKKFQVGARKKKVGLGGKEKRPLRRKNIFY